MITEGTRQSGSVRFRLNGQVKTINHPITGAALHVLAGNPTSLTMGGREIPNSSETVDLKEDQELTSKHTPGVNLPGTVAEKPLTEAERKEKREARSSTKLPQATAAHTRLIPKASPSGTRSSTKLLEVMAGLSASIPKASTTKKEPKNTTAALSATIQNTRKNKCFEPPQVVLLPIAGVCASSSTARRKPSTGR